MKKTKGTNPQRSASFAFDAGISITYLPSSVTANLITKVAFSPVLASEEQRYSPASQAVTWGRVRTALVAPWLQLVRIRLRYLEA